LSNTTPRTRARPPPACAARWCATSEQTTESVRWRFSIVGPVGVGAWADDRYGTGPSPLLYALGGASAQASCVRPRSGHPITVWLRLALGALNVFLEPNAK